MLSALVSIAFVLLTAGVTGWVATDALARGRRWIRWGVATSFFFLLALIAWLVVRRRAPIVRERLGFRRALPIYAAALCLVLLQITSQVVLTKLVFQVARVEGQAMASTVWDQDRLIVDKWSYLESAPRRGDIVMLLYPLNPEKAFIKRVIGIEGDMVQIRGGRVFVNERPLDEPYVHDDYRSHDNWGPQVIPEGYYFVMGDHRNNSSDSRHWGFVPLKYIVGRIRLRWWPLSSMRTFG